MGHIIGICNQKGGTGKTTTAINLSSFLALAGLKTLLVDMDPQGNATSGVGVDKNQLAGSMYEVLLGGFQLEEVYKETEYNNLWIAPSHINLTGAELELIDLPARERQLRRSLQYARDVFDWIIIDAPPSLSLLTLNVLVAVDSVVIPLQCEYYALEGLSQLAQTIDKIRDSLNPALYIEGVLLTMADFRTNLTKEVIEEARNFFGNSVYKTVIPRNVRLSETPSFGKPIYFYDKDSLGAKSYFNFAQELLKQPIEGVYHEPQEESIGQGAGCTDTE